MTRRLAFSLIFALMATFSQTSCGRPGMPGAPSTHFIDASSSPPVDPIPDERRLSGQTLYLPAYSSVATADGGEPFPLAITVVVRNTDPNQAIVVSRVSYFDQRGVLVKEHLERPISVAARASSVFFVKESDASGGMAASFMIEWAATTRVTDPLVESIMVGTASMQGISMRCQAQVIADHRRPTTPKPPE